MWPAQSVWSRSGKGGAPPTTDGNMTRVFFSTIASASFLFESACGKDPHELRLYFAEREHGHPACGPVAAKPRAR